MRQLKLKTGRALVIVAHPDDETIWMGGIILAHKRVQWTIISLCRKADPDRAPRFLKVCSYFHARPIISDLEDEGVMNIEESIPAIQKRVTRTLKQAKVNYFDYIFTHNRNGEYGHPRHKGVNRAVLDLIQRKKLLSRNVFLFSYELKREKKFAEPDKKSADLIFNLPQKTFREKKFAIEKLYGFSPRSFESRSSSQIETFRDIKSV